MTGERRPTKAELALELANQHCELFASDQTDDAYAAIDSKGTRETWPVPSTGFRRWLQAAFYAVHHSPLGGQALKEVVDTLAARAIHSGVERPVYVRVAATDGRVTIDVGDAEWSAVTVTATGAERIRRPVEHFVRTPTIQPISAWDIEGSIDELQPFANLSSDAEFRIMVGWLIAALAGVSPFPILVLQGEQGSGKSTLARMLRSLVDPSSFELRSTPREERDLVAAARNNYVLVFDNLSAIPEWLSDSLCRVATGGGLSGRRLYTDDSELVFEAARPVILNGIPDLIYRPDLASRCLILHLQPLDGVRHTERELWPDFRRQRPRIFGALLRGVAASLANLDSVRLPNLPRLADFVTRVTAAEPGLRWESGTFLAAFEEALIDARMDALANEPVFDAVAAVLGNRGEWRGTASELLMVLTGRVSPMVSNSRAWPTTPAALGNRLRRIAPVAREIGYEIEFERSNKSRNIVMRSHKPEE